MKFEITIAKKGTYFMGQVKWPLGTFQTTVYRDKESVEEVINHVMTDLLRQYEIIEERTETR